MKIESKNLNKDIEFAHNLIDYLDLNIKNKRDSAIKITLKEQTLLKNILRNYILQKTELGYTTYGEYPYNLLEVIFDGNVNYDTINQDNIDGLYYVINNLPRQYKDIIIERFQNGLTLKDVALKQNATKPYISCLEYKALKSLRSLPNIKFITNGLKTEVERLHNIDLVRQLKCKDECVDMIINELNEKCSLFSLPIEDLSLSNRICNCLKRANVNTMGDILKCSEEDLKRIRNLGERTLEEIRNTIKQYGYELKQDED